jgi:hypothetical protein
MRTLRSTGSQGPRVNHSALGMPKQLLRHYPGADSQHQLAILSNSFPNKTFTRGTPPKYVFAFPEYQNNSENFNFWIVHIHYFTVTLICSRHSSVSKPITSNILCLFLRVRKLDKKVETQVNFGRDCTRRIGALDWKLLNRNVRSICLSTSPLAFPRKPFAPLLPCCLVSLRALFH